jgi:hypothetical protein
MKFRGWDLIRRERTEFLKNIDKIDVLDLKLQI